MKQILFSVFLFIFSIHFSQNQIKVISSQDKKPISKASVFCDDNLLGKTNDSGILNFKTKCKKVDVVADNFENEEAEVKKTMEISLKPSSEKTKNIEKIVIKDQSDPRALKILDELNKHYKDNSPQSLESYNFKSYSKISIDVDKDSIDSYKDFIAKREDSISKISNRILKQKDKEKKDSLIQKDIVEATKSSQYFLMEKATEHNFSKKYGEKTNILDTRISGFPNPVYEMLAVNISNLNRVPRQVRPENRSLYRYFLSDTIEMDNRKTFVIKFKEITNKQTQNPRKFSGKIYVDAESFALKKLESASKKRDEGNGTIIWKPIDNKWFLDSENLKIKMGSQSFDIAKKDSLKPGEKHKYKQKIFGNYLYLKTKYFDFKTNIPQKSEDFKGYSLEVKNTDGTQLEKYRTDSLTNRESATYTNIDQFVKKHNFDKKISLVTNLMKGNWRIGMVDLDLTKILDYNKYEGLRLGTGAKLNEKFSKTYSPDAYFGYGFKDHTWKYGVGLDFKLSQKRTSIFRIDYVDDVSAVGKFSRNLWSKFANMEDFISYAYNGNFYHYKGFGTSFEYDISNSLTGKISVKRQNQEAKFNYQYQNFANDFTDFSTTLTLKYSPNDKNMMTPGGKLTFEKKYPQFFVNYEKGSKLFGGNMDYQRFDVFAEHQFRTKMGVTNFKIFGGISSGTAPIWKNFEIAGTTDFYSENVWSKISLPSNFTFTTMPSARYYADQFAGFFVMQKLPFRFKTLGKKFSSLDLEYKSAIGNFKNPEFHHFDFEVLNHYYQEAGLMWNRFLGSSYSVGFYYRLGYYQSPNFKDNLGIEIKF